MNRKYAFVIASVLLVALAASACLPGLPVNQVDPESQAATQQAIIMQAVESTATTMAMLTQISFLETKVAAANTAQPQPQPPTNTPEPGVVASVTGEPTLTASPLPPTATNSPVPPTNTPVPPTATQPAATATLTTTPVPCNQAQFVSDVTVADGTTFLPGATFTKTWRLKNTGACTWTTSYDIVFVDGNQLGAAGVIDMPGNVANGQVIDINVKMKAPMAAGRYRANWKLRDASGVLFGVGLSSAPFYADIRVIDTKTSYELNFVDRMCEATWTNNTAALPCPGTNNDARGFALRIENPTLETGYVDDEPVLQMYPQMITDGIIRGKYPPFRVEKGHHFVATIGCANKANACDVIFRLDYQIGTEKTKILKTWHEVYDGEYALVDVDLSGLAGKDVRFQLTVLANGSSNQDRAQWLMPKIVKK